jgi:hypothetical protein
VLLMHAPPHLDGHHAPQPECDFRQSGPEFSDVVRRHHIRDGTRFVMTGAEALRFT